MPLPLQHANARFSIWISGDTGVEEFIDRKVFVKFCYSLVRSREVRSTYRARLVTAAEYDEARREYERALKTDEASGLRPTSCALATLPSPPIRFELFLDYGVAIEARSKAGADPCRSARARPGRLSAHQEGRCRRQL